MKSTMGIILTGGESSKLKELTNNRSSSAIPVAGRYRAIDFVLSNMVNSGIDNVGVITQYSFRSLMDHLGSGKEWDLDRRNEGLFIFPPFLSVESSGWYKGSADAMYNNIMYLKRSLQENVLVAQGNCVYKMAFKEMQEFHRENNADITIAYREMSDLPATELSNLGILNVGKDGRVVDMQEKRLEPQNSTGSMGIYLLKRELLISLLEEAASHGHYDFVKDILIKKIGSLGIYGYKFEGYWRSMSTVNMYYNCNMDMLNPAIRNELFISNGKIYTKVKDEPPAKFNDEAEVHNSIIGDGCIIEGSVENSVLFRGVTVKKGTTVKNSILMQGTIVEENASINNAILDKNVWVSSGTELKSTPGWPIIVRKNTKV